MACNFNTSSIKRNALFLFLLVSVQYCTELTKGEKSTHLHFYLHEVYLGPNATVATVVKPSDGSSFGFGMVGMIDDDLKDGPDPSSRLIGRVQGMVAVASMAKDNAFLSMLNVVFTDGPYNGSTLAVFGRVVMGTVFERSIIGGTGEFRMARGYIVGKQVPSGQDQLLIFEFDAYVSH